MSWRRECYAAIPLTLRRDPSPILHYVTDRQSLVRAPDENLALVLAASIRRAIAAGIDFVQIREKDLDARALVACVADAVEAAHGKSTQILVNDRLDVAIAANAAGVHLGEGSIPLSAETRWRSEGQNRMTIGVSCHSVESCCAAEREGADYISFGPVFETPSKKSYGAPKGLEELTRACSVVNIPVIAIGGISESNVRDCLSAGAAGIAAIRFFQESQNLADVVARLRALKLSA